MPVQQAALKTMKKEHGAKIVDKVTIDQLIGGARSIKCMLWETSLLDPLEVRARSRDGYGRRSSRAHMPGHGPPSRRRPDR